MTEKNKTMYFRTRNITCQCLFDH